MRILIAAALVLPLLACSDEPGDSSFPLQLRGPDLMRRGASVPVLEGVTHEMAASAAYVRYATELLESADGRTAAIVVAENRRLAVVVATLLPNNQIAYATALAAPPRARVSLSPQAARLVMLSEEDGYLPPDGGYRLNRGLMCVRLADLKRHESLESALEPTRRDERWYSRPDDRFVPPGAIEVTSIDWGEDSCVVCVRDRGTGEQTVLSLQ